jgi:hypothetical protein
MSWIDILDDPAVKRAYDEATSRMERSYPVICGWGTCTDWVDPHDGKIHGGMGRPLCGCDNLPGWNAARTESKPKPSAPAKARGRHGSRVQRSRHRRAAWVRLVKEFA